jgi:MFS family permease
MAGVSPIPANLTRYMRADFVLLKIGCGGLFTCSTSVIAHWFKKKRGRALGCMSVGSALSGTTIPIIVKNLLPVVG